MFSSFVLVVDIRHDRREIRRDNAAEPRREQSSRDAAKSDNSSHGITHSISSELDNLIANPVLCEFRELQHA
jgi:hypothetical protein